MQYRSRSSATGVFVFFISSCLWLVLEMMMMMHGRSNSRCPFTASQWQELEHQALIYSYMASGVPIPCDLILPLKRSFVRDTNASPSSLLFPPQTQLGWNCFQVGFGAKSEDPEPGRCRRTDGKKWRCSKEAFPDSKYCEKHMHRGKNRSRKPEEISFATRANRSSSSSSFQPSFPANLSISTPDAHHLSYSSPTSSRRHGTSLSFDSGIGQFHLKSGSSSVRDHRCAQEMKGFHGSEWGSSCQFRTAVGHSNLGETKQSSYSLSKEEEEERKRPLRHFFDEWPQRKRDPWMTASEEENSSCIKTQLSISFPKWFYPQIKQLRSNSDSQILILFSFSF